MSHLEEYQKIMADWISTELAPYIETIKKREAMVLPNQKTVDTIFNGFREISDTIESLEFAETLLSVESPRSKRISKEKYLIFIINTYLQDVYILKERLNTYATKIKRMHNKIGRKELTEKHIEPLFTLVKDTFQGLVETRGGHVHARRYTDQNLLEAGSFALVAEYNSEFEEPYNFSLKRAKLEWRNRIRKNNKETEKLINEYFKELTYVVTDDGKVIIP